MLVLTRKVGQAIVIAGEIRVAVVEVEGGKVRLAVEGPREVTVDREEVHLCKLGLGGSLPAVFTQQEYDGLADQTQCEPATFRGRRMFVRGGPALTHG
jgi:carbon storage regulator